MGYDCDCSKTKFEAARTQKELFEIILVEKYGLNEELNKNTNMISRKVLTLKRNASSTQSLGETVRGLETNIYKVYFISCLTGILKRLKNEKFDGFDRIKKEFSAYYFKALSLSNKDILEDMTRQIHIVLDSEKFSDTKLNFSIDDEEYDNQDECDTYVSKRISPAKRKFT